MGRKPKFTKDLETIENRVSIVFKQLRILKGVAVGRANVLTKENIDHLKEQLKREVQSTMDAIYIQVDMLEQRENVAEDVFQFQLRQNDDESKD